MTITTNDGRKAILQFFENNPTYSTKSTKLSDSKRIGKYKKQHWVMRTQEVKEYLESKGFIYQA